MYSINGIDTIATITELRAKTGELAEHAKKTNRGILIQKNNEPYAVLVSYDLYKRLMPADGSVPKKKRGRPRKNK